MAILSQKLSILDQKLSILGQNLTFLIPKMLKMWPSIKNPIYRKQIDLDSSKSTKSLHKLAPPENVFKLVSDRYPQILILSCWFSGYLFAAIKKSFLCTILVQPITRFITVIPWIFPLICINSVIKIGLTHNLYLYHARQKHQRKSLKLFLVSSLVM